MNTILKINFMSLILLAVPLYAMDADKKVEHGKQEELNTKFWGCFVERFYHDHPDANHFEVAQSLLAQKADINTRSPDYLGFQTPLELALGFYLHGDSVSWLLERGADDTVNKGQFYDWLEDRQGNKLMVALYYEDKVKPVLAASVPLPKTIVDLIVSKLHITQADIELFQKIETGKVEEIAQLLARNADPNTFQRTQFNGFHTPLRSALKRNDCEVVKLLLVHGADPNFHWYCRNYGGFSPYRALPLLARLFSEHDAAARACDLEKLKLLLEHNADPHLKDEDNGELSFLDYAQDEPELMRVYQDFKQKIKDRVDNHFLKNADLAHIVADYAL